MSRGLAWHDGQLAGNPPFHGKQTEAQVTYGDQTDILLSSISHRKRENKSIMRRKRKHSEDIIKPGHTLPTPAGLMPEMPQSTCTLGWKAQNIGKDIL